MIEHEDHTITLYNLWNTDELPFPIAPSNANRDWVDSAHGWPYKCLPLRAAAQTGWTISSPVEFTAYWDGSTGVEGVVLHKVQGRHFNCIASMFGLGVITFNFPYLFRTPHHINTWVRGPANWITDGIQALEGIVETDWLESKFTMNWKFTRPNQEVRFRIGDPICVIVPVPRGMLEKLRPQVMKIADSPKLKNSYDSWASSRAIHVTKKKVGEIPHHVWQKDYFRGLNQQGEIISEHQSNISLSPFVQVGYDDQDETGK